jgi:hypothetical protein
LEEAIELLATVSENIDDILKELILLKSRLTDVSRNYRQGILGDDDKNLEKNKIRAALIDLTLELKAEMKEMNALKQGMKQDIDKLPYPNFRDKFREIVDPYYIASSKSYLHIVFGSIADVENMSIAVGCSQDFDLFQVDSKSVLGALLKVKVGDQNAIEAVNEIWPVSERPQDAGLGMSHFVKLPTNSNNLEGVVFTVTTRDISSNEQDKGIYTNTPVQGIPIVLDKVFTEAKHNNISALAVPLLGAGHANIARTRHNPALKMAFEKAILAITIDECLNQFLTNDETLRRIVIVVFSDAPQSVREHGLWELAIKMLHPNSEKRIKIIDELVDKIG